MSDSGEHPKAVRPFLPDKLPTTPIAIPKPKEVLSTTPITLRWDDGSTQPPIYTDGVKLKLMPGTIIPTGTVIDCNSHQIGESKDRFILVVEPEKSLYEGNNQYLRPLPTGFVITQEVVDNATPLDKLEFTDESKKALGLPTKP